MLCLGGVSGYMRMYPCTVTDLHACRGANAPPTLKPCEYELYYLLPSHVWRGTGVYYGPIDIMPPCISRILYVAA